MMAVPGGLHSTRSLKLKSCQEVLRGLFLCSAVVLLGIDSSRRVACGGDFSTRPWMFVCYGWFGGAELRRLTYCFVSISRDTCLSAPVPLRLNLLRKRSSVSENSVASRTRPIPRCWSALRCCTSKRTEGFFPLQALLQLRQKAYKKRRLRPD